MKIVASAGHPDIAMVYVMDFDGNLIECVEAVQPPRPREEKWVLMISTLFGCPIACQMCDAGGHYRGKLTESEMFARATANAACRPRRTRPESASHSAPLVQAWAPLA